MTELAFLDRLLVKIVLPMPQTLHDRFYVRARDGYFLDKAIYIVDDKMDNKPCLMFTMRNDVDAGLRERNFCEFLTASAHIEDWPKLVDTMRLKTGEFTGIVTSGSGASLYKVVLRSGAISYANGVRLCYQLFALLDTMHELNYVHRNIDMNTVRVGENWRGDYVAQLNGFYYTTHMVPEPKSYGMNWRYQSIPVCDNETYNRLDDFVSALYVVITSQGINMLQETAQRAFEAKERFDDDPRCYLRDNRHFWIADVYEELMAQRENNYFDRHAIWVHLVTAVEGCDPSTPFECHFESGESTKVILDSNPKSIRVPHH